MFVMGCGPEARCADCPRVAHCRSLSSSSLQKEPVLPVIRTYISSLQKELILPLIKTYTTYLQKEPILPLVRTYISSLQKEPIHAEMVDVVQGPSGESGA